MPIAVGWIGARFWRKAGWLRKPLRFFASNDGCAAIRLIAQALMTENPGIYRTLGYQQSHGAMQGGLDRVPMRKAL